MNLERIKKIKNNELNFKNPKCMVVEKKDVDEINNNSLYKKEYLLKVASTKNPSIQGVCTLIKEYLNGTIHDSNLSKDYVKRAIYDKNTHNLNQILTEKARIYIFNYYGVARTPTIWCKNKNKKIGSIAYDYYNYPYYWDGKTYKKIQYFNDALEK